jgi:flagellar biosynthesis protein FlhB
MGAAGHHRSQESGMRQLPENQAVQSKEKTPTMTLLKITILLITIPFIFIGIVLGLFYNSFLAGIVYSEKLIEESIKP